jgi:hypothetical protein
MKKILITALSLFAVTATVGTASAQGWRREDHPYERRYHSVCQDKSQRLAQFERRSSRDGFISPRERETIRALERDLARTCGGYRYRGRG